MPTGTAGPINLPDGDRTALRIAHSKSTDEVSVAAWRKADLNSRQADTAARMPRVWGTANPLAGDHSVATFERAPQR